MNTRLQLTAWGIVRRFMPEEIKFKHAGHEGAIAIAKEGDKIVERERKKNLAFRGAVQKGK